MGPLLLILTTIIWGTAFLAQKFAADSFGPFALTAIRNSLAGVFLVGCVFLRGRSRLPHGERLRSSAVAGVWCGLPLFAAMVAQQFGIEHTTPGICAFLTTNYIVFVPLFAAILTLTFPRWYIVIGVVLAMSGTYFISVSNETFGIGRGEAWSLLCAMLFSVQMIVVARVCPCSDVLVVSAVQMFVSAALSLPFAFLPSELPRLAAFSFSWSTIWPVLYCGVMSSGVAYTLQNFGQARTPAALAAVLLSLESVFGALSGYVFLGDLMSVRQVLGCALVFVAVVLTQLADSISSWRVANGRDA